MLEASFNCGDWDVESLQAAIFHPSEPSAAAQSGLWEKATGNQPESIDSRPKIRMTRVVGSVGEDNLTLAIQDERIDWVVRPRVPSNQPSGPLFTLGAVEDVLPLLRKAIQYTLETTQIVSRMAFIPVLVKQVPDTATGLKQLSKYLPHLGLDSMDGVDFTYQINRRRRSTSVPHVRINRLAKWSTEQIGGLELRVSPSDQPRLKTTGSSYVRKLNLDVNTDPTSGAMSRDKIAGLFDELVSIAGELATEGDIS